MYKVFFNDSTIQFLADAKKSLNYTISPENEEAVYNSVNQLIERIWVGGLSVDENIWCNRPEQVWQYFCKQFTRIDAAGGLVKNAAGQFLFINRLGKWDLPKGKIEKRETVENAAVREVEEECGISGVEIVKPLESTYHIYKSPFIKSGNPFVLKETKWFLMQYRGSGIPVPQVEEDIVDVRWISASGLDMVFRNTYLNLIDFLKKTLPAI